MTEKINWNKLKENKALILKVKRKNGLQSAVYVSEGILGLKRGEILKNRPKIKRIIKSFK